MTLGMQVGSADGHPNSCASIHALCCTLTCTATVVTAMLPLTVQTPGKHCITQASQGRTSTIARTHSR